MPLEQLIFILLFGNHHLQLMEENSESLSLINKPATLVAGYIGLMIGFVIS